MQRRDAERSEMPPTDVLKIDKDCHLDQDWIEDYVHEVVVPVCCDYGTIVQEIKMCNSRRKGLHFYVHIDPPVEAELANRLQFLLGDDCQRVDFNRARIESRLEEWNKLFEVIGRRLRTIYRYPGEEGILF